MQRQYLLLLSGAHFSFLSYLDEEKSHEDSEIKRRGRCWHVSKGSWHQHERVNEMLVRGAGGTQVSACTLPQGQWQSDTYETRQRRIHLVVLHRGCCYYVDSLSTSPSLSIHALNQWMNKQRWTLGEIRGVTLLQVCVFVFLVDTVLYQGLDLFKKADMSLLTE